MKKKFLILAVLCTALSAAFSQNALDIDTAISHIASKIEEQIPQGSIIGSAGVLSDTEELSRYITDRLESALRQGGTFTIVERGANLNKINKELDYQYMSGAVSDKAAVDLGKQLGAQYMLSGYFEQLGSYMSLNIRVSNVATSESPVIENQVVSSSAKLNELLGDSRALTTANDYLTMIARCREKLVRLERDRSNEISTTSAQIRAKHQSAINEVNTRVQKKNQSDEVFNRKKTEDLNRITQQRDNEIKGETDKIKIKYDEQYKSIENSEKELKQRLSQTVFSLTGSLVDVRMGEFRNNDKPQNWPVTIQSKDALVKYRHETKYVMVSSEEDNEEEFNTIEDARSNGKLAGEIKYQIVPKATENAFDIKVQNIRVYLIDTKQTLINEQVEKIVSSTTASIKGNEEATKITLISTDTQTSKKKVSKTIIDEPQPASITDSGKPARVSDAFGIGPCFDPIYGFIGLRLNAFSSTWENFFVDWATIKFLLPFGENVIEGSFISYTMDCGWFWNWGKRVFPFIKLGLGVDCRYIETETTVYTNEWNDYLGYSIPEAETSTALKTIAGGLVFKVGLGMDIKLSDKIKLVVELSPELPLPIYDAPFLGDMSVSLCFGKPVKTN